MTGAATPDGRGASARDGRPRPLVVRSRPAPIVAVAIAGVAVVATMLALRRSDLDTEDDLTAVVVLVLGFWLVTQALGLAVRRLVSLRRVESPLRRHRHELVLDLDPACAAPFAIERAQHAATAEVRR